MKFIYFRHNAIKDELLFCLVRTVSNIANYDKTLNKFYYETTSI